MREHCLLVRSTSENDITIDVDQVIKGFNRLCRDSVLEFIKGSYKGRIAVLVRVTTDRDECINLVKTLIITLSDAGISFKSVSCKNPFDFMEY